jgi:hypothetical protein
MATNQSRKAMEGFLQTGTSKWKNKRKGKERKGKEIRREERERKGKEREKAS